MNRPIRWLMLAMIAASFLLCSVVVILDAGLSNTPFETTDGVGHTMGFNDRLFPEHYRIIFSNFGIQALFTPEYYYDLLLLGMHGFGAWMIIRGDASVVRSVRRFFWLQSLVFPAGWIGFLALPETIHCVWNGTMDREGIIDIPFVAFTAQPIWLATAMIIGWMIRPIQTPSLNAIEMASRPG